MTWKTPPRNLWDTVQEEYNSRNWPEMSRTEIKLLWYKGAAGYPYKGIERQRFDEISSILSEKLSGKGGLIGFFKTIG